MVSGPPRTGDLWQMKPGGGAEQGDMVRHARLRAHYDALGAGQDAEAWYEDPALDDLCAHGRFEEARSVFEFGVGTGRFAERLLASHMPDDAEYTGTDLSPVMVALARERLERFGPRCRIDESAGPIKIPLGDGAADRVVAAFVLDLLTGEEIVRFLSEARRVLDTGGLLCAASLDDGRGLAARLKSAGWRLVHLVAPLKVGGCRPIGLRQRLGTGWTVHNYVRRNIKYIAVASICAEPGSKP